ncbi:MAG TPA: helix-turn-helix transcriptional regulator [Solirubrobacterales bacterium]|nr:helix-turn-helix transcriptional regulator [Solirubrobacterales bacterium]
MSRSAGPIAARLGRNLAAARRRSGISQEEAALRASLHRTEIGLLERGERMPRIDTAIKLAGAVGVPCEKLFEGIEWTPGSAQRGAFVTSTLAGDDEIEATAEDAARA